MLFSMEIQSARWNEQVLVGDLWRLDLRIIDSHYNALWIVMSPRVELLAPQRRVQ